MMRTRGEVYGVVPGFLRDLELTHNGLTGLKVVEDMRERKHLMLEDADAVVALPGGSGTFEELFEALTLIQTGRMTPVPFLIFGEGFWRSIINWEALSDAGTIAADDLELFKFVETADEAIAAIDAWGDQGTRGEIPGR